jgi:predicted RNase H-like HicB family nuclease
MPTNLRPDNAIQDIDDALETFVEFMHQLQQQAIQNDEPVALQHALNHAMINFFEIQIQ